MKLTSIIAVLAFAFVANANEPAAPAAAAPTETPAATQAPAKKKAKKHKKGHKAEAAATEGTK